MSTASLVEPANDFTANRELQEESDSIMWQMVYVGVTLLVMFAVLLTGPSSRLPLRFSPAFVVRSHLRSPPARSHRSPSSVRAAHYLR